MGVEPVCRVLQIAPSAYYAAGARPACARHRRDVRLKAEIRRVWDGHRQIYGADKVWAQLNREAAHAGSEGHVARCTVERLMHQMGLRGVVREKKSVHTNDPPGTVSDGAPSASSRPTSASTERHCSAPNSVRGSQH